MAAQSVIGQGRWQVQRPGRRRNNMLSSSATALVLLPLLLLAMHSFSARALPSRTAFIVGPSLERCARGRCWSRVPGPHACSHAGMAHGWIRGRVKYATGQEHDGNGSGDAKQGKMEEGLTALKRLLAPSSLVRCFWLWMMASGLGLSFPQDFDPSSGWEQPSSLRNTIVRPVQAAYALTDEQQLIADVWRRVDKLYLDRTFNGQDWFALRQAAVKKNYQTTAEVYNSIKDMLSKLGDPYTRFLTPAQYESLYGVATGTVAGIGVSLFGDEATGALTVAEVEKDSPASQGNLQIGDVIVMIDGQATKGLVPDESAALLRGPPGSKVGIVVQHKGSDTTEDVILTRQEIKIQGVSSKVERKDGKRVGLIRIRNFSQTTSGSVAEQLQAMEKQGIDAVVIDLRGNPGGYLGGGIDTARIFLPSYEKIVSVIGRTGITEDYTTTEDGFEISKPLVMVVDKRTASAAEVLSAALKENNRAKLVGEKTFGKGVIQTVEAVTQGCGLSVTIAKYYTPTGQFINKKGIEVDFPVPCDAAQDAVTCVPGEALAR